MVQSLQRIIQRFLKKLKIELSHDPAIPLLGTYLEKNMVGKDTCIPKFTAALFTTAKTWKQPKCPPTETWIKMGRIYTMEHYSATKKNKTMASAATQCNHRTERSKSETERQTPYELTYTWV